MRSGLARTPRPQPSFRADFTSRTGQLSPAAIHPHFGAAADQRMRAHVIVDGDDHQIGLGLPVQREVDIAGKDLPSRTVVELDDAALGVGRRLLAANIIDAAGNLWCASCVEPAAATFATMPFPVH